MTLPADTLRASFDRMASEVDAALLRWLADPATGRAHGRLAASLFGRLSGQCEAAGRTGLAVVLGLLRDTLELAEAVDAGTREATLGWLTGWRDPLGACLVVPPPAAAVAGLLAFLGSSPVPPAPHQLAELERLLRPPAPAGAEDEPLPGSSPQPEAPVADTLAPEVLAPLLREAAQALEDQVHLDLVWREVCTELDAWSAAQQRLDERLDLLTQALDRHVVHVQSRHLQAQGEPAGTDPQELDRCQQLQTLLRLVADAAAEARRHGASARASGQRGQPVLRALGQALAGQHRSLLAQGHACFADAADSLRAALAEAAARHGRPARLVLEGGSVRLDAQVLRRLEALLAPWLAQVVAEGMAAARRPDTAQVMIEVRADARHVTVVCEDDVGPAPRPLERDPAWRAALRAGRGRARLGVAGAGGRRLELVLPAHPQWLQALLVEAGGSLWALPGDEVVLALAAGQGRLAPGPVLHDGERRWPCVWLAAALGREAPPAEGGSWPAVLVQGHDGEFALLVERIVEARELMLRPLDPLLQRLPLLAGAAVQGEGEVLWVLDLAAIEVPPLPA